TAANDTLEKQAGFVQWRPAGGTGPYLETVNFSGLEHVTLNAGAGNDTIHDPGQDTTILGGPGDDVITIDATTGTGVTVDGGDGADTYVIVAAQLQGPIAIADSGTTGSDSLTVQGSAAPDTIVLTADGVIINGVAVSFGGAVEALTVDGGGGAGDSVVV